MPLDLMIADDVSSFGPNRPVEFQSFRTGRIARLVERAVRAALRWLRAEQPGERKFVRTFRPASGEDLIRRLYLSARDMHMLYNQDAKTLLVGPEKMYEMEGAIRAHAIQLGTQELRLGGSRGIRVLGIDVVMVPWMEGALLLPFRLEANRARAE